MKKIINIAASSLILLCAFTAYYKASNAPMAYAATSTATNGQALEIAPPLINLTVNPGQTVKTQLSLRNVSKGDLVVSAQVNDFVAAGDNGTPKILLNDDTNNPYSIKGWVTPIQQFTTAPRKIYKLPVTINVPANASPGGHYGVLRFTAQAPGINSSGVSLSASLGSLMLITVKGNLKESLSVQEFSVNHDGNSGHIFESAPLTFVERIKNSGNIHEEPTGQVTITDMFGRTLASLSVNLPPKNILPDSTRKFEEKLDSTNIGSKHLFGRYKAKLNMTYGTTNKQTLTATLTFWVIPYRLIGAVIVILILGFFIIRFFIKRYNRRIITKASRSRRR